MRVKIINILSYQAGITAQGISYTGEKDWALNKLTELLHQELQKAREEERERCIKAVSNSRTLGEKFGVSMIAENARWQALYDMQKPDQSELDQPNK